MTQKEIERTEIEAPYELPDGWKWIRMGDYLDIRDGTHDSPKYVENGYPFVTSKNLVNGKIDFSNVKYISEKDHKNFIQRSFVENNDILFAMIGSIGNPVLVKKDREFSIKNVALFKPRDKEHTNMYYVYFYLINLQESLKAKTKGGMQPFIPLNFFRKELFIPLPSFSEQQRIVNRIETMFSKLDQAQEKVQLVLDIFEKRKAAILHKAFTGELTANWRKEHGVPDDSWAEKTVGDCLIVISDKYDPEKDTIDGIQYIGLENIESSGGIISMGDISSVKSLKTLFKRNDLLYGKLRPYLDKHDIADFDGICSTDILVYRSKPEYEIKFFNYLFSQKSFIQHAVENSKGINLPRTSEKIISAYSQKVPSLSEQKEIVRILDTVLGKETQAKDVAQTVLDQLSLIKKSILVHAFRGKI